MTLQWCKNLALPALLLPLCSGCAFYEKRFVSEIVVEGPNHRPKVYDEGALYINAEPAIRMRTGCRAFTTMVATMFPLIPIPFGRSEPPHDSIAGRPFSLTLRHRDTDDLDLSTVAIAVEIAGHSYPLRLVRREQVQYTLRLEYEFAADLTCGEVQDGLLSIELNADTVRNYRVQFEEGVQREVAWHPGFVT